MIRVWRRQQAEHPETSQIIQKGLDKLSEYRERMDLVPAYVLAMGKVILPLKLSLLIFLLMSIAVNPSIKLRWYTEFAPEKAREAKELFIREVSSTKRISDDANSGL